MDDSARPSAVFNELDMGMVSGRTPLMKFERSSFSFVELCKKENETINTDPAYEYYMCSRDVLRAIVATAHGQQEDVSAKRERDGDGAALAREVGRALVDRLQCPISIPLRLHRASSGNAQQDAKREGNAPRSHGAPPRSSSACSL